MRVKNIVQSDKGGIWIVGEDGTLAYGYWDSPDPDARTEAEIIRTSFKIVVIFGTLPAPIVAGQTTPTGVMPFPAVPFPPAPLAPECGLADPNGSGFKCWIRGLHTHHVHSPKPEGLP